MAEFPVPPATVRSVAKKTLAAEQVVAAQISVAFVDHPTMHALNLRHLDHDESTDVLSFLFDDASPPRDAAYKRAENAPRGAGKRIDGEIIVCTEMARDSAPRFGWSAREELILYIVHGLLHLCGYDDLTARERRIMRRREGEVLSLLGIEVVADKPRRPERTT
jgi:probable rRNA maturation factor